MLVKDDCIAYRFIYIFKHINEAIKYFKKTLNIIEKITRNKVCTLRTDQGTEFCNTTFDTLLDKYIIDT